MDSRSPLRGLAALTFAMALSQFFRSCLAVMAPELQADLGLSPAGFGTLSSSFFLAFGLAQIPVGMAFDRFGVGAPTRALMLLGVASAVLFVFAPNGLTAMLAQAGLGLACAPIFMGLMHFASEQLPPRRYAAFVSRANAVGMLGALCATAPLGWAVHAVGWRPAIAVAALCMAFACAAVWRNVRDHGHPEARQESPLVMLRASVALLGRPALWTLIPMCMAMAAGTTFRNAWGGPYLASVFGLQAAPRGLALALLSLGAFCSALALPWLVARHSMRATVLGWSCFSLAAGVALAFFPSAGLWPDLGLLTMLATLGVLHPLVMGHGRSLLDPAMRGRGLGLLNTFVFLGSAITAWAFGQIADAGVHAGTPATEVYMRIFALAAAMALVGVITYSLSPVMEAVAPRRTSAAAAQARGGQEAPE